MKWRWRRRVKVAPGVAVNFSPNSVGASVGGPAGRVSANTKGRVAVGQSVPGTGLYSQQVLASGAQPAQRQNGGCIQTAILGAVGVMLLFGCSVIGMAMLSVGSRPTATPTAPARAVEPIPVATPAPPTATLAATATTAPTEKSRTVLLPLVAGAADAVSVADTPTAVPTDTPWPTMTVIACDCSHDTYNCDDAMGPLCFGVCLAQGAGDVHDLDRDGNGLACEAN